MPDELKISIITPCYNSAGYLRNAIQSVVDQHYNNFEHIIVDGGSTDGTLEILSEYTHLIWISEPDNGQSDAMNKGFRMSTGDIIVYLNADDYFLPNAFKRVIPYFEKGAKFIVGKVRVEQDDGSFYINDPKVTHDEMLRHWESNAFCVNPVGYFYRREVQENVPPFNPHNHIAMDLEFLLECSLKYEFTKMMDDEPLGVFRKHSATKTAQSAQNVQSLFSISTFHFIDKFLEGRSPEFVRNYHKLRKQGYERRTHSFKDRSKKKRTLFHRLRHLINMGRDFMKSENKAQVIRGFVQRMIVKINQTIRKQGGKGLF